MTVNLHIVRNSVSNDSRVLKETAHLKGLAVFDDVVIAGFHENLLPEHQDMEGRAIWRIKLKSRNLPKTLLWQGVKFFEWRFRLLRKYRKLDVEVIHCHDLEPLAIAVRLKQLTGARLVYDAHELETERHGASGMRQWLNRVAEKRLMTHVDRLVTVSPSILAWYRERYPEVPMHLVRNVPERPSAAISPHPLRAELNIPKDALLFLYLGRFTSGRGIETTLEAFKHHAVHHHVLFLGSGPLESVIRDATGACPRIHLLPPVPPSVVLSYAAGADVGLSLIEDSCLNYRYCLPNKLFENLLAGRPVLASDLPDQAAIIRQYNAGWTVPVSATALIAWLLTLDNKVYQGVLQGLAERVADLAWPKEAQRLANAYEGLVPQ